VRLQPQQPNHELGALAIMVVEIAVARVLDRSLEDAIARDSLALYVESWERQD
jgi:hypothetical protein